METEDKANLPGAQISSITEDPNKLIEAEENQSENANMAPRDNLVEAGNRPNNADEEQESKIAHSAFKKDPSVQNSPPIQVYQDNPMTLHQQISLYNIVCKDWETTTLLIYNTDIETKEEKTIIMQTPKPLDSGSCITQLPSGKLFCYGNYPVFGITLIIDEDGGVQMLPSGTPCYRSSAIYFNNSVYCFGGRNHYNILTLSNRFDLDRNEWVELAPLPKSDHSCNSIIFNGNILISGFENRNLVRYSIGDNSFTTIPYQFAFEKRKILINEERLYLIECYEGSMYESEVGSDTAWRQIGHSTISFTPDQTYCSYNKGGAYISCSGDSIYKFNFADKSLTRLP